VVVKVLVYLDSGGAELDCLWLTLNHAQSGMLFGINFVAFGNKRISFLCKFCKSVLHKVGGRWIVLKVSF